LDATLSCTAALKVTDRDVTGADLARILEELSGHRIFCKISERRVSI
jgi:hypothetical protein